MRTTIEFPPELMRRAKARAASRGESLKTLLTRAVSAELGQAADASSPRLTRVELPLFGAPGGVKRRISNADLARALDEADAAGLASGRRR
jgi:hypothetical protein